MYFSEKEKEHTIRKVLPKPLPRRQRRRARLEPLRANNGHDLKVAVRAQRGARAAVVQRTDTVRRLRVVGNVSRGRVASEVC